MLYLAIGGFGMLGALLRYLLGVWVHDWWFYSFPLATLATNYIGSFGLAWFSTRVAKSDLFPNWFRLGFGTGLIGSFTTFSTFSMETTQLMQRGDLELALLYVLLSLWGGWLLAWVGYRLADLQLKKRLEGVEAT